MAIIGKVLSSRAAVVWGPIIAFQALLPPLATSSNLLTKEDRTAQKAPPRPTRASTKIHFDPLFHTSNRTNVISQFEHLPCYASLT